MLYTQINEKVITTEAYPVIVTDTTPNDTDDPAIWYNQLDSENSLILGTDKGDTNGGIYVFDLRGNFIPSLCITNLKRPNNIDVEYGFEYNNKQTDIAVFTERDRNMLRVLSLPDCKFIDNGGIPVFTDDSLRFPMGVGLYKNNHNEIFAFVSRKIGPPDGYIYQYKLYSDNNIVKGQKVRAFGKYSGKKEIESIAIDDELGFIYYSDETVGVRKYYADAEKGNQELALFAQNDAIGDHEGISIYKSEGGDGFIIVSDQQANRFLIYNRLGTSANPHDHRLVKIVKVQTIESDGSEILNLPFGNLFPHGIFVAMSANKTFQYYHANDIVNGK